MDTINKAFLQRGGHVHKGLGSHHLAYGLYGCAGLLNVDSRQGIVKLFDFLHQRFDVAFDQPQVVIIALAPKVVAYGGAVDHIGGDVVHDDVVAGAGD